MGSLIFSAVSSSSERRRPVSSKLHEVMLQKTMPSHKKSRRPSLTLLQLTASSSTARVISADSSTTKLAMASPSPNDSMSLSACVSNFGAIASFSALASENRLGFSLSGMFGSRRKSNSTVTSNRTGGKGGETGGLDGGGGKGGGGEGKGGNGGGGVGGGQGGENGGGGLQGGGGE